MPCSRAGDCPSTSIGSISNDSTPIICWIVPADRLYGTLIWDAPGAKLDADSAALLRSFVADDGVGLVVFSDTVATPVIAELTGVAFGGRYTAPDELEPDGEHFITRGSGEPSAPAAKVSKLLENAWKATAIRLAGGVQGEPRRGDGDCAARRAPGRWRCAALGRRQGGDGSMPEGVSTAQIYRQQYRDLFKRSLVWTNGYLLYTEYPRSVLLFMDDMGASDKTFYPGWHYPTLGEETIRTALIGPLQRHRAVMVQNVITGFVDRKSHRILKPWIQTHVVDELDASVIHDFRAPPNAASTRAWPLAESSRRFNRTAGRTSIPISTLPPAPFGLPVRRV